MDSGGLAFVTKKFVLPGKGKSCGVIGVAGVRLLALDVRRWWQQQGGLGAERLGFRDQQEVRAPRERGVAYYEGGVIGVAGGWLRLALDVDH